MKIDVRFKDMKRSEERCEYVRKRVWFSLNRFATRIASVRVKVEDINGPRGGIDRQCGILVRLINGSTLWVEGRETDWRAAVDRTSQRMANSVARSLENRRASRFESGVASLSRPVSY